MDPESPAPARRSESDLGLQTDGPAQAVPAPGAGSQERPYLECCVNVMPVQQGL